MLCQILLEHTFTTPISEAAVLYNSVWGLGPNQDILIEAIHSLQMFWEHTYKNVLSRGTRERILCNIQSSPTTTILRSWSMLDTL